MRTFLWSILIIGSIFGLCYFINIHQEDYQVKGVCRKTMIEYDHRAQQTDYTVIIQYEDGDVVDLHPYPNDFFTYKEGQTYYFTRTRWVWNKTK
jgi:hypothetical protein